MDFGWPTSIQATSTRINIQPEIVSCACQTGDFFHDDPREPGGKAVLQKRESRSSRSCC